MQQENQLKSCCRSGVSLTSNKIGPCRVYERASGANFILSQPAGSYCKNIFKGTLFGGNDYVRYYSL